MIHRAQGGKEAPTLEELTSWAWHEDERVPVSALDALLVLLQPPISSTLLSDARDFFTMCVNRAIDDADQAGFLWTPLLDALARNIPWWVHKHFAYAEGLVQAKARLAEGYLLTHPEVATLDLLTAVRERGIRDAIFAQIPSINERAVRLILASEDPPEGMTSHPSLTPEATDVMWHLLRCSYRARLISFPKAQREYHETLDRELARIGYLLRDGSTGDGTATAVLDSAHLEDLLSLMELGVLGSTPASEIAETVVELDRSDDEDLIRRVWRTLLRQGLA